MEILSMIVVVSAIVDPWVTTFSFVVALAMRIQGLKPPTKRLFYLFGTKIVLETPISWLSVKLTCKSFAAPPF